MPEGGGPWGYQGGHMRKQRACQKCLPHIYFTYTNTHPWDSLYSNCFFVIYLTTRLSLLFCRRLVLILVEEVELGVVTGRDLQSPSK